MRSAFNLMKYELNEELINILEYWKKNVPDIENGGFYGRIDSQNRIVERASKGIILNTRILWSFAAAGNHLKSDRYGDITERAFQYLISHFVDNELGGVFWELDFQGNPVNKRKQVYAQAFAIYALSEYFVYSKSTKAKTLAIEHYELLETHARDREKGGYREAFDRDWSVLADMRLSPKDLNTSKTMNTHLHILEAYTSLLRICDADHLKTALKGLVELFLDNFLDHKSYHFQLFFDDDWNLKSDVISFGHDIEAAWLLMEAVKVLGDPKLIKQTEALAVKVTDTFLTEALDSDGAVMNEKNTQTGTLDRDRHWWPQVEAMVGLSYANQIEPKIKYTQHALDIWEFVKTNLLDRQHGEWYFRVNEYGKVYSEEDKVSMWKAPYHTSRACILLNSI